MENSTPYQKSPPVESARSNNTGLADISENIGRRDALYLFACYLEWYTKQSLVAYQELLAAIDGHDCDIRNLAEKLLSRSSLKPPD